MRSPFLFAFPTFALLAGCSLVAKPAPEPPPVVVPPRVPSDTLVANSGFATIYEEGGSFQGFRGLPGSIEIVAFTLEANQNLNLVTRSSTILSDGNASTPRYTATRIATNLQTKVAPPKVTYAPPFQASGPIAELPTDVDNSLFFKPYSNFLSIARLGRSEGGGQTLLSFAFTGDKSTTPAITTYNGIEVIGNAEMGYYFPQLSALPPSGRTASIGHFTLGLQDTAIEKAPYAFAVCRTIRGYLPTTKPEENFLATLFDTRWVAPAAGSPAATPTGYAFVLRAAALQVYEMSLNNLPRTPDANAQEYVDIKGVPTVELAIDTLPTAASLAAYRHYSADGTTMSMLFNLQKRYWSFSYNFATKQLTKGLQGAELDYANATTVFDFDEAGAVYYSGTADAGKNATGVSIYKKSATGSSTLVGADNFLRLGKITKLQTMYGKAFAVVTAQIEDPPRTRYTQVSIVREN
jgi:hypothetical protein